MRKILIIGPSYKSRGGIATLIGNMLRYKAEGYCFKSQKLNEDVNIVSRGILYPIYLLVSMVRIFNYDIVHIHVSENGGYYRYVPVIYWARLLNRRIVIHVNSSKFDLFFNKQIGILKNIIIKSLDKTNLIITVGQEWYNVFIKLTATNVVIVHNFIEVPDENLYNPVSENIVTTGYVGQRKGYYDLIEAIPKIIEKFPKYKFSFCGNGEVEQIKERLIEKQINDNVELTGWLSKKQIFQKLKSSSIYVLPTYNEGMPLAILEAMSFGLPIITTKVGAIPSLINENENGIFVRPGNIAEISNALINLIDNEELRMQISNNNYQKIKESYSIESGMNQIIAHYKSII